MAPRMTLAAHSPLTPASAPAPGSTRMPRLKYRNPLPADQTSLSSRASQDTVNPSTLTPGHYATPGNPTVSDLSRSSYETANLSSPSLASISSSATSSNESAASAKKKKTASIFGFLTLKEPSQLALEQFAEASRKSKPSKGTSSPSSNSSSTQSNPYAGQKLPPNVPKVNSKWDGIPDSVKPLKHRQSTTNSPGSSTKSNRTSWSAGRSLSSRHENQSIPVNDSTVSVMTTETRNPPNSVASVRNSMQDLNFYDRNHSTESLTSDLPEISYYFPDGPMASGALPVESVNSGAAPSTNKPEPRVSTSTVDEYASIEQSFGFQKESPASSTDSVDTIVRDVADNIYRKLNEQPRQDSLGGSLSPVPPSDDGPVPDSHEFLFKMQPVEQIPKNDSPMTSPTTTTFSPVVEHYVPPRPVQNFSRPISTRNFTRPSMPSSKRSYRNTQVSSTLPTLYEASITSTESLGLVRDEQEENRERDDDADSIAPSTIAPSELSTHWHESPRERLGLGGRIRMSNEISPWDDGGPFASSNRRF